MSCSAGIGPNGPGSDALRSAVGSAPRKLVAGLGPGGGDVLVGADLAWPRRPTAPAPRLRRLLPTWTTTSRAVQSSQGDGLVQLSALAAWTRCVELADE